MKIIPVIDLSHGRVVRAEQGRRLDYRPLLSPLCPTADPFELVRSLRVQRHFPTLYIADLDAIQQDGNQIALLSRIHDACPDLELWFDGGFRTRSDLEAAKILDRVCAVVGSETWSEYGAPPTTGTMLSIDSDTDGPRDPSGICEDPLRRPSDLILMNLARVGSRQGPDTQLLKTWRDKAPGARLYLAGGVRDIRDLAVAASAGAHGVLVASALHDGSLDAVDSGTFT